ncbi:SDR family NAD(P)-dependent oxidoreductase [Aliivibrio kagoshimensis]|uniref:SDR family NAD(P)-dependent oxidoreductase n=1 Tax=Aliivibrio kagoshimensis TaxID=2910230 RepID=UPI003D135C30
MKRVLITGASSGIGHALALSYDSLGYEVWACGRNVARLEALIAKGNHIQSLQFDINDNQQIARIANDFDGSLDLLILNAGNCEYIDNARQFDGELFERVVRTNLISVGYLLQAWLPKMKHGSQLALIGSSVTLLPLPRAQAYGASKAGLAYLADTLSLDLKEDDIRVSLVSPGFVESPLTDKNDFSMPMIISVKEAAKQIVSGLQAGQRHIQFPKRFIWVLKLVSWLPFSLLKRMVSSA